jgi:integrase
MQEKASEQPKQRPGGQLIQKGKDKWQVIIFLGYDGNGKKKYFKRTFRGTQTEAERYRRKLLHEQDTGAFVAPSPMTIDEYLNQWLENAAKQRWSEGTFDRYTYLLNQYVRPAVGMKKLSKLQPLDIQSLYTQMHEKGLSPRTIQIAHNILNSALKQAVKWRMLSINPAQNVDKPKQVRKEMQALSREQTNIFLRTAREDIYFVFFALMLDSGARPSELLALQWKDVDFEQGIVTIRRTLYFPEDGSFKFTEPKTKGSRRVIHVAEITLRHLREHRRLQAEQRLRRGAKWQDFDLVFTTRDGLPLMLRNILRRHFRPVLQRAGLPKIRLYDLRHTCATLLLLAGVNVKVVSERLGHSSVVLTLDVYSHVLPSMQTDAAGKMNNLLYASA